MCVPWLAILRVVQRWRTDTCLPFSCQLYDVVMGKEPRLWNCPKSSCHGAFPDTRNSLEPSCVQNSPFLRGTREVVLLSSWVWKDVNGWALEIGIACTYSNPVVTGGQKHTHTHTHTHTHQEETSAFLERKNVQKLSPNVSSPQWTSRMTVSTNL